MITATNPVLLLIAKTARGIGVDNPKVDKDIPSKPTLLDYVMARVLAANIRPMSASHLAAVVSYLQSLAFVERSHIWNYDEVFSVSIFGAKLQYFEDRLYSGAMSEYFHVKRSFFGKPYISLTDRARLEIKPSNEVADHTTLYDESSKAIVRGIIRAILFPLMQISIYTN